LIFLCMAQGWLKACVLPFIKTKKVRALSCESYAYIQI
jgi:hypothetical protein